MIQVELQTVLSLAFIAGIGIGIILYKIGQFFAKEL